MQSFFSNRRRAIQFLIIFSLFVWGVFFYNKHAVLSADSSYLATVSNVAFVPAVATVPTVPTVPTIPTVPTVPPTATETAIATATETAIATATETAIATATPSPTKTPTGTPPTATPTSPPTATRAPGIILSVSSDPPTQENVVPAEFITYTAVVTSTGTEPLTNVFLKANLSDGIDYIPGSATPTPSDISSLQLHSSTNARAINASTLTWDIGTMTQNQRFEAQFRVRVDQDAGTQVSVQFVVISDQVTVTSSSLVHVLSPTNLEDGAEPRNTNQRLYLPLVRQ